MSPPTRKMLMRYKSSKIPIRATRPASSFQEHPIPVASTVDKTKEMEVFTSLFNGMNAKLHATKEELEGRGVAFSKAPCSVHQADLIF